MRLGSWPIAPVLFAGLGLFFAPLSAHAANVVETRYFTSTDAAYSACDAAFDTHKGDYTSFNASCDPSFDYQYVQGWNSDTGVWDRWSFVTDTTCPAGTSDDGSGVCSEGPDCEAGAASVSGSVALNPAGESCVDGCTVQDAPGEVSITTPSDGMTWGNFVETGDVCTGADGDVQPMPSDNCYTGADGDSICYPMDDNPSQCGSFNGHYVCLSNMSANTCEFGGDSAVCTGGEMPDLMGTETVTDTMEASIDSDGSGPEEPTDVAQHSIGHNTSDGTTSGGGSDGTVTESDTNPDGTPCDPETEECGLTLDVGVGEAGRDAGEGIDTSEFDQAMGEADDAMQTTQDDGAWDTPSLSAPMQPSQSCSAFDLDTGQFGQTYSMDLCPFISLVQTALAWFFSLITAIAIFHEWRTA